jgi:hypothetical protein
MHAAGIDPLAQLDAGILGQQLRQDPVEAPACQMGRYDQFFFLGFHASHHRY